MHMERCQRHSVVSDTARDSWQGLIVCWHADKGHVAHLNYHQLGFRLGLHRAVIQRLVKDLLTRLGVHIVNSAALQVCSKRPPRTPCCSIICT